MVPHYASDGMKGLPFLVVGAQATKLVPFVTHVTPKSSLLCEDKMLIVVCSVLTSQVRFMGKLKWQMLYHYTGKRSSQILATLKLSVNSAQMKLRE